MLHVVVCCAVASVPCNHVVTSWERADLLAVVCVVFYHFHETGLSPPVIVLTVPRWHFFCGSFMFFCLVFVMPLCASVYLCLEITCWEGADLLDLVYCV